MKRCSTNHSSGPHIIWLFQKTQGVYNGASGILANGKRNTYLIECRIVTN